MLGFVCWLLRAVVVKAEAVSNGSSNSSYDYDMITIGAGSGGVRASRFATSYGMLQWMPEPLKKQCSSTKRQQSQYCADQ